MKRTKKLIVGNWKMNPLTVEEAKKIATQVKRSMRLVKKVDVVLCPPFVYIPLLSKTVDKNLYLGAQDAFYEEKGSFTGEVSFRELTQFNVSFVILGHSERRKMGETDQLINKKVRSVVGQGMEAIVCVGESIRDTHGDYFQFVKDQILWAIRDVPTKLLSRVVIAYEPIWAIGAKDAMSPMDLHEMSIYIKKVLKDYCGDLSNEVRILYGGSADKVNAEALVKEGNVSGLLVGRQSLNSTDFSEMIKIIDTI
ncbi:MAG: triose-phosphate isomerase [Parcubacteria group bacterium]